MSRVGGSVTVVTSMPGGQVRVTALAQHERRALLLGQTRQVDDQPPQVLTTPDLGQRLEALGRGVTLVDSVRTAKALSGLA